VIRIATFRAGEDLETKLVKDGFVPDFSEVQGVLRVACVLHFDHDEGPHGLLDAQNNAAMDRCYLIKEWII
jgi:hypothetical protein